jgi:hypothetical protein
MAPQAVRLKLKLIPEPTPRFNRTERKKIKRIRGQRRTILYGRLTDAGCFDQSSNRQKSGELQRSKLFEERTAARIV